VPTPEAAADLLELWNNNEFAADPEVVIPLLRVACSQGREEAAFWAAQQLAAIEPTEGLAAIRALVPRSVEAATWLVERGLACPEAEARLWHALAHPEARGVYWRAVASAFVPLVRGDPRLVAPLRRIVAFGDESYAEEAVGVLAEVSRDAAIEATLTRLAAEERRHWRPVEWLAVMARGGRPGNYVVEAAQDEKEPRDGRESRLRAFRWATDMTLDELVSLLIEDAPDSLDFPGAIARLLGVDVAQWSELWRRVEAEHTCPEEAVVISELIDIRPDDGPGQRLARLYLRLRLPEPALLERDEPEATVAVLVRGGATPIAVLQEILFEAFGDDAGGLRRFMAAHGLTGHLPTAPVAPVQLRFTTAEQLLGRGMADEVVRELGLCEMIASTSARAWVTHARAQVMI
jgi:hypothetical protein